MARVSTYLNFEGNTAEAFDFYKDVFGGEYLVPTVTFGEIPADPSMPSLSAEEQSMVMHAELSILDGHVLMATDMLRSMGHERRIGNNVTINLEPDTRTETQRLYGLLSEGASDASGLQDMPFGYWGTCLDRFGVRWMFNCAEPAS
jgi:PhnB protein